MIGHTTIVYITRFLTAFIAYLCAIIPAGYMRAWVAKKCGDSTAEDAGFLTFNPFTHIDPIGFIMLVFFNIGWGRQIPVNPLNIEGPWRKTKIALALFSDALTHFVLASIALVIFVSSFNAESLLSGQSLSSWSFSLASILGAFISLNIFLILISLITNIFLLALVTLSQNSTQYLPQYYYLILIAPLIIILIFGNQIEQAIYWAMVHAAQFLIWLLGILPKGK